MIIDMKSHFAWSIALVVGLATGAILTTSLRAQSTPPAYLAAEVAVRDPDLFAREYAPKVAATLQPYGGRVITSGKLTSLEGNAPSRFVMIAFDSVEKANGCVSSAADHQIAAVR